MGSKKEAFTPRYLPGDGVTVYRTVKENIEIMLRDGYFDGVKTCVIAASRDEDYDIRFQGSYWECQALIARASNRIQKELD
jgi:hypothetical protein